MNLKLTLCMGACVIAVAVANIDNRLRGRNPWRSAGEVSLAFVCFFLRRRVEREAFVVCADAAELSELPIVVGF